jgi:hypothetical protein
MRLTHTDRTAARTRIAVSGSIFFLVHAASAGVTITPLVLAGDTVDRVGLVTAINSIAVNDAGDWLVEADTDFIDTAQDLVVLKNGAVAFREGQSLNAPVGATISSFDSVYLNASGNTGWNLFLDGPPSNQDSGLFFNDTLILQEGAVSTASGFSAGTPYIGFFESRMDNGNRLFVVASVDDPAIASSVDRALVRIDYNEAAGTYTELVLAKEGDLPAKASGTVTDFGTGPENSAINQQGEMFYSASLTGATATNGALYINGNLVATKGDASSIPGRTYTNIGTGTRLDLNDSGDSIFNVTLSGDTTSDLAIVRNGEVFVQEGDEPAALPGRLVTGFNSAPIRIDAAGRVTWYANLNGDTATNQAIFREGDVVAQKGVTKVAGLTFTSLAGTTATGGITEGLAISPSGKYVIFRGVLNGSVVGAFLAEFDDALSPDLNGDGTVNAEDLAILLGAWGTALADLDGDGTTNASDLAILLGAWNG